MSAPTDVEQALATTLAARKSKYGAYVDHAKIAQKLKKAALAHRAEIGLPPLSAAQQEGLDMIFHKIGRIVNGDPDYADSWVDIAGYATRVVETLPKETK